MRSTVPANGRHSPGGHSGTSQGVPAAVPEESELSDVSPFATALTAAPAASPVGDQRQHPQQQHDDAKPHKPKFRFYCFLGCGIKDMLKEGNSGGRVCLVGPMAAHAALSSTQQQMWWWL